MADPTSRGRGWMNTDEQLNGSDPMARARERSEAKNAVVRSQLEPLAPGERPGAVTVAAIAAFVIVLGNSLAFALNAPRDGYNGQEIAQLIIFNGMLVIVAIGMWLAKYWAVLGFQAILSLQIIILGLSITRAESAPGALVFLFLMLLGGYMFWKLIRAMARIQMPESPLPRALQKDRDAIDDVSTPESSARVE